MSKVAFIPARAGSKRIPDKNIKNLNGHPLLAYTIHCAIKSNVFDRVICATDSVEYADIARYYGAEVPFLRDSQISAEHSPDIEWVEWMLEKLGYQYDIFSILRPTSPFRTPETISRAMDRFLSLPNIDSLRAVEKCSQHPGKMWVVNGEYISPFLPLKNGDVPYHSSQYASLPEIYVQNASLEIAWSRVVKNQHSISGSIIAPFFTTEQEGFDINIPSDWSLAELYISNKQYFLPDLVINPFIKNS